MNLPTKDMDKLLTLEQDILITDRSIEFAYILPHIPITWGLFVKCERLGEVPMDYIPMITATILGYYMGHDYSVDFLMDHLNEHIRVFICAVGCQNNDG